MGSNVRALSVPAQQSVSSVTVANLRAEIARKGWSGAEFGRMAEWSRGKTFRKLSGKNPLTVDELDHAARILGIDVIVLLRGAA